MGANPGRWGRTGKPGVLQSMGSQGVALDWETEQQLSLEARNLNQVSLGWCQGVGSPALLLGALEGLLHVPAHIHHLHSWAHGPSFLVKTNSVSSSNLCDLDFYVNISHLWVWLSWLHFTVTLAILQIIQGNFFISKSVIKSHLQSLFFYVK